MNGTRGRIGQILSMAMLMLGAVVAALAVSVTYGIHLEYGDPTAAGVRAVTRSLQDAAPALLVVALLVAGAIGLGRRRLVVLVAAGLFVATLVGVPGAAMLGTEHKQDRVEQRR